MNRTIYSDSCHLALRHHIDEVIAALLVSHAGHQHYGAADMPARRSRTHRSHPTATCRKEANGEPSQPGGESRGDQIPNRWKAGASHVGFDLIWRDTDLDR
jgi:hypothetical protein